MSLQKFNQDNYAHFVTTKTFHNEKIFKNEQCCHILINELDFYRKKFGFKLLGYCIMLDHLHLILWWDVEKIIGLTISKIMQVIKSHSAKEIVNYLKTGRRKPSLSPYSQAASEGLPLPQDYQWVNQGRIHTPVKNQIWQKDFYDFNIFTEEKLIQKLNYIHYNPVKAKLVKNPEDWKYSSFGNYYLDDDSLIKIDKIEI